MKGLDTYSRVITSNIVDLQPFYKVASGIFRMSL